MDKQDMPYPLGWHEGAKIELIEYLGYDRHASPRRRRDSHRYRARCAHCGDEFVIQLVGIRSRIRNKTQRCKKCSATGNQNASAKRALPNYGYPRHPEADLFAWGQANFGIRRDAR